MPEAEKDLMTAVGDSFGITTPAQPGDTDDGGGGSGAGEQLDLPLSYPQGVADDQSQDSGGEQRQETGSDRHTPQQRGKDDQLFTDKPRKGPKGELLDRNGQIVATTRREKQLAYNLNRAQYAANASARQMKAMQQHLQAYQGLDQVMKQHNLSPAMAREALQLRAMAEQNPIMAIRDIIARVLATGATMEDILGNEAVPQINARVITNELDRRLGPVEQAARQRQRHEQIQEQAQVQMENFVQTHPHAETHGVEISNLVSSHGLTPERAYFELRSWVERRGLDFTSPLKPQIEAAMQRQRTGGGGNSRRASTPGDMRGVAPNGGYSTSRSTNSRGDFRSNTPWRDIASAVFTELNSK
jgi:hypothetical protein